MKNNNLHLIIPALFTLLSFSHCSIKKPNGGTYGGFPSYDQVNDDLNDILGGPVKYPRCINQDSSDSHRETNDLYPFGNPLNGALAIHATKYQSCIILNNIRGSVSFDGKQPDVIDKWRKAKPPLYPQNSPSCRDVDSFKKFRGSVSVNSPIDFTKCSIVSYCQTDRSPSVSNNSIDALSSSTDCSSFVSTAFRAVGLKMNTLENDSNWSPLTTSTIGKNPDNGSTCFESPVSSIDDLIRSGDIINVASEHVVMIDKVGRDPFRIEEIFYKVRSLEITKEAALDACSRLNLSRFNFSIIHSTKNGNGNGIVREQAGTIISASAKISLEAYGRSACRHFISQYPEANTPFDSLSGFRGVYGGKAAILRHVGRKNPKCVFRSKPKIKGEECINECIKNYTI